MWKKKLSHSRVCLPNSPGYIVHTKEILIEWRMNEWYQLHLQIASLLSTANVWPGDSLVGMYTRERESIGLWRKWHWKDRDDTERNYFEIQLECLLEEKGWQWEGIGLIQLILRMVRSSIFTSTLLRRKTILLLRRYGSFGLHQPLPWFALLTSSHDFIWFCINGDMAPYTEPFRKAFFLRLQSFKNVF